METAEELEHEVVNFATEVCRHDRLKGVTIRTSDGDVMKGTCLLHLRRWGNEKTLLVSREEVTLAGRRESTPSGGEERSERFSLTI